MKIVIAGLGAAAANAARTITAERPDAQVVAYGAEPYLYYARPKLPAFLAGETDQDSLYFYEPSWYRERGIEVHTGAPVERADTAAHTITLAGGSAVAYDRLLIATGAHPFMPPIEGSELTGVFNLWTIDNALAIRSHARDCRRAVVIGGGVLGQEAARSLRALGLEVTVLERSACPMPRQLDPEGGEVFRRHVEAMGINLQVNASTEGIEGTSGVEVVRLQGGERIPAELVLIAAGGRSNLGLAQASGLETKRGIIVDEHLQTSAADVYAAGDVAEFRGQVYGIVPAAIEQGRAAARNMAEIAVDEYTGTVPTNTLKIVGLDLTSMGEISGQGEGYRELRRADGDGRYLKLTLKDGRLQGAILLGHKEKVNYVSQAVARHIAVGDRGEALLADGFDWKALLSQGS